MSHSKAYATSLGFDVIVANSLKFKSVLYPLQKNCWGPPFPVGCTSKTWPFSSVCKKGPIYGLPIWVGMITPIDLSSYWTKVHPTSFV